MSEKLPFSPYPPRAPPSRSHTSTIRRPRRRLLPFLLLAILGLIYFSRSSPPVETQYGSEPIKDDIPAQYEAPAEHSTPQQADFDSSLTGSIHKDDPTIPQAEILEQSSSTLSTSTHQPYTHTAEALTTPELIPTAMLKTLPTLSIPAEAHTAANKSKIALDAHIMSKCPDARDCLRDMVVPAMEQISDLVHFNLSFVQTIEPSGNVKCRHGPAECLGDTLLLCAQSLYPTSAVRSLGFANCMVGGYKDIPHRAHVQNCALEHGVDFDKLNDCATDSGRGETLLRDAVRWTRGLGVQLSCTVRVAGQKWCVRDGGEWKECEGGSAVGDLVGRVRELAGVEE